MIMLSKTALKKDADYIHQKCFCDKNKIKPFLNIKLIKHTIGKLRLLPRLSCLSLYTYLFNYLGKKFLTYEAHFVLYENLSYPWYETLKVT